MADASFLFNTRRVQPPTFLIWKRTATEVRFQRLAQVACQTSVYSGHRHATMAAGTEVLLKQ
jgi:hypothetical protein